MRIRVSNNSYKTIAMKQFRLQSIPLTSSFPFLQLQPGKDWRARASTRRWQLCVEAVDCGV